MGLPNAPVTLTIPQVEELQKRLSTLRHDINNHLSLVVAAAELIKFNPASADRMCSTLAEQPGKISDLLTGFSNELEKALGISRP